MRQQMDELKGMHRTMADERAIIAQEKTILSEKLTVMSDDL